MPSRASKRKTRTVPMTTWDNSYSGQSYPLKYDIVLGKQHYNARQLVKAFEKTGKYENMFRQPLTDAQIETVYKRAIGAGDTTPGKFDVFIEGKRYNARVIEHLRKKHRNAPYLLGPIVDYRGQPLHTTKTPRRWEKSNELRRVVGHRKNDKWDQRVRKRHTLANAGLPFKGPGGEQRNRSWYRMPARKSDYGPGTLIFEAAHGDVRAILKKLVQARFGGPQLDVNALDTHFGNPHYKMTALTHAAVRGDIATIRALAKVHRSFPLDPKKHDQKKVALDFAENSSGPRVVQAIKELFGDSAGYLNKVIDAERGVKSYALGKKPWVKEVKKSNNMMTPVSKALGGYYMQPRVGLRSRPLINF